MPKVINLPPERRNTFSSVSLVNKTVDPSCRVIDVDSVRLSVGGQDVSLEAYFEPDQDSGFEVPTKSVDLKFKRPVTFGFDQCHHHGDATTGLSFTQQIYGPPLDALWRELIRLVKKEVNEQHGVPIHQMDDDWLKEHLTYNIKFAKPGSMNILAYRNQKGVHPIMAFVEPHLTTVEGKTSATLKARALLPNGDFK